MTPDINMGAVVVAAVVAMVLGFLWYGPLFGKPWMQLMGFTKESIDKMKGQGMAKNYLIMVIGALVMAYVLAHALEFASAYTNTTGVPAGLMAGFWNWLGFVAPVMIGAQLWEGKPWKLFVLTGGYQLVSLLSMGVILALWQ